jgi:hypothetical protein
MTQLQVHQADTSRAPVSRTGTGRHAAPRSGTGATALVVGIYLVLAVLANWNAWTTGATKALQPSQDPKLNAWLVAWTPFAVTHGVNPLFSHWVNVPYGANYAANVAIPLLGIVASPITAIWGPVAAINFLISLAFFSSAIAGYCFVRHWTTWRPAAFLGGLLFGFSPYVVAEGMAHVHTMFVCLIPFIFLVLDEIFVRQRYSARVMGVVLGLLVIAQYFISSEVLATTALMVVIAAVLVALFNLDEVRAHVIPALPAVGIALGITVIVLAFPVFYAVSGPLHYTRVVPYGQYQSDLLSAVLPTSNQLIAPKGVTTISKHFASNISENGAYLGIPLVILLLATVATCRRSKVVIIGSLLALSAYVLSLGSPLIVGNDNTGLHLPGGILHHIPVVNGAVLSRFSVFMFLFAALLLGVALERLRNWSRWPKWWTGLSVAVILSGVVLVPLLPALPYPEIAVDTPSFFTTAAVDAVPQNSVAVVYPPTTPVNADSMLWQASAAMRFKMPGGYALVPTPGGGPPQWLSQTLTTTALQYLLIYPRVRETSTLRHALRVQWRHWKVQTFIMGPGRHEKEARRFVTWVIGRSPVHTGGVYVWYGVQRSVRSA